MDVKKVTRNPLIYVLLIGVLLIGGFMLISSLGSAKQVTTQQGLDLLKGGTVTKVVTTDGDQRVDMELSKAFEGADAVQFYYVSARAAEVVTAINNAAPKDGFNDSVPGRAGSMGSSLCCCRFCCWGCCSGGCSPPHRAEGARSCSSESRGPSSSPRRPPR